MPNSQIRAILLCSTAINGFTLMFVSEDRDGLMPLMLLDLDLLLLPPISRFAAYGPPPARLDKARGLNLSSHKRTGVRGNR